MAVEFGVLAAFSILWLAVGGHPADGSRLALLMLAAAAMGMQSTAVRRLGQMSTTYLTSTLTGILTGLALRRWPEDWRRSTGILAMAVTGAAVGACLLPDHRAGFPPPSSSQSPPSWPARYGPPAEPVTSTAEIVSPRTPARRSVT